jgi:hypothetical protein
MENDGVVGSCSFSLFAAQGLRGTDNLIYSELIDVLQYNNNNNSMVA